MSTYKQIQGTAVQNNAGTLEGAADGQLWYDSTNTNFKYSHPATAGAWSTGGNMNEGRYNFGSAGIQTSALGFGSGSGPTSSLTEAYNGTNWTEVGDLNTGRL